ncbi:PIN domain-containing protein [Candidatus Roizmanbacteria bacterium]|nr:PIN domain-containing protein [Candidatus Roizmanbacteria bacterium]
MYKIFLDSDVVISSLISDLGASHRLINNVSSIYFISDASYKELLSVVKKLGLEVNKLKNLVKDRLRVIKLQKDKKGAMEDYKNFVKDLNDAHIVAGAVEAKVNFLITFNLKDFEINKIKAKHNIQIMTPGMFLQFLRSK